MGFSSSIKATVAYWDSYVLAVWFAQWLLALAFSRYSRWRALRGGGDVWANRALLPAYEVAIGFKKLGLIASIVCSSAATAVCMLCTCEEDRDVNAQRVLAYIGHIASFLYAYTYFVVLFVLLSHSAGTRTMWRALGTLIAMTLVTSSIAFFELNGPTNAKIKACNSMLNTTMPLLPSFGGDHLSGFITGVPGIDHMQNPVVKTYSAIEWWIALLVLLLTLVAAVLMSANVWQPRQPALAVMLCAMYLIMQAGMFFSDWEEILDAFGFNPIVLLSVVEMPLKYLIMLYDSRYWSKLSLDGDNRCGALDVLERGSKVLERTVAVQMMGQQKEMETTRVPHIHWTSIELCAVKAVGAGGKVWSAMIDGQEQAVKQIRCDVLDVGAVSTVVREIQLSWLLAESQHIVRCDGFSINPPDIYIAMEFCAKGSLYDTLADGLSFPKRLVLARDAALAVAHMHQKGFVHRDIKSPNFFIGVAEDDELTLRLGDFGEAVTIEQAAQERPSNQIGTPTWMAPEIIQNWRVRAHEIPEEEGAVYVPSADVFSLTVVLWEIVTGQQPYAFVIDPLSGKLMRWLAIEKYIVVGLRPHHAPIPVDAVTFEVHNAPIPNGEDSFVSERLRVLLETGWHHMPEERPDALQMSSALEEEIDENRRWHQAGGLELFELQLGDGCVIQV